MQRRKHALVSVWLLSLLAASTPALADGAPLHQGDFVLVRARGIARTITYTNTYPAAWDKDHAPNEETIPIGGYFKGRFRIHAVWGGTLRTKFLNLKLTMGHSSVRMPEMFLVLDLRSKNDVTALWWDGAGRGFCLDPKKLYDVGLQDAGTAVARRYPCKDGKRD
jgi:hypothetical protein